jgi:hypothetical protein
MHSSTGMDGSDRGETVKLYDVSPGTDCMGAGLQVGEEYLIFASEEGARDYRPEPCPHRSIYDDLDSALRNFRNCAALVAFSVG